MEIRPKPTLVFSDAMPTLLIPNTVAYVYFGALILAVPAFIAFAKGHFPLGVTLLVTGGIGGGILGFRASTRPKKLKTNGHFIAWDNYELRIKGRCGRITTQVRFDWREITQIGLGRVRRGASNLFLGGSPLVQAVDALALIVREKNGHEISFDMVGAYYAKEDLRSFLEAAKAMIHPPLSLPPQPMPNQSTDPTFSSGTPLAGPESRLP